MLKTQENKIGPHRTRILVRRAILTFPQRAAEYKLNEYFKAEYDMTLLQMCLKIWAALKFLKNSKNEVVIILPDKELQKIAQFITFGNRDYRGSKILQSAIK